MDSTSKSSSSSNVSSKDKENSFLWKYVNRLEKTGDRGGNWKWICNFCGELKQGTYTTVKAHLLKQTGKVISVCKKVGHDDISEMRKMENEVANRILVSQPKRVPLPTTAISSSLTLTDQSISNALKRKKIDNSPIGKAFDIQTRARLDAKIARMFYTGVYLLTGQKILIM